MNTHLPYTSSAIRSAIWMLWPPSSHDPVMVLMHPTQRQIEAVVTLAWKLIPTGDGLALLQWRGRYFERPVDPASAPLP